jgi:hypothetical protein
MASGSTAMLMDSSPREEAYSHQLRKALTLHQEIAGVADALDIVANVVAVFLWGEPGSHPLARVNTQPIALNTRLAFILAVLSTIRDLKFTL